MHFEAAVVTVLGAAMAFASASAARAAWHLKTRQGGARVPLVLFWAAVTTYASFFTLLRGAYLLGSTAAMDFFYIGQTVGGASTIVALASIIARTTLRQWGAGFATGLFLGLAGLSLGLIFGGGVTGPIERQWGVEYLPDMALARALVGSVYVLTPLVMSGIIVVGGLREPSAATRSRHLYFAGSISLMFGASAIRYVWVPSDALNVALAATAAMGAFMGCLSYRAARAPQT